MFLPDAASTNPIKGFLPTLISGAALITPTITLVRWLQERRYTHRLRDHVQRSKELLAFIENCPDMLKASQSPDESVIANARVELGRTLATVNTLLQRQNIKGSLPKEVSRPARLLLFYAPRSWAAMGLHLLYHIQTALFITILFGSSYAETTDSYQWSEFVRMLQNPLFSAFLLFMSLLMWTIWYSAITKDRWDRTLPSRAHRFFLANTPLTVRELLARLLLVWNGVDWLSGVAVFVYRGTLEKAIPSWIDNISLPATVRTVNHISPAVAVIVGYLWARVESQPATAHIPFPRNLRFLYPAATRREGWWRIATFWFVLSGVTLTWYFTLYIRSAPAMTDPDEWLGFVIGTSMTALVMGLYNVVLPLYGSYRCSLANYWSHLRQSEKVRVQTAT